MSDLFVERERDHIRGFYRPDWDWWRADAPSVRTPPRVPLERARVALVATAGAIGPRQRPFAKGDEGDESFRLIDRDAPVRLIHPGYDTRRASRDPDVVFPLALLRDLAARGVVGEVAPRAASFMGWAPDTARVLEETGPAAAQALAADAVDLVLLVPS